MENITSFSKTRENSFTLRKNKTLKKKIQEYTNHPLRFVALFLIIASALITIGIGVFLLGYIVIRGVPYLSLDLFQWEYTSTNASMMPAIINTLIIIVISLAIAIPFGVGAAIYLVEYAKQGTILSVIIRLMAETLSAIPSIVYGLFGYLFFVIALQMKYSILAGALTLSIMILPFILRSTQEALIAVPNSYREASYGLGARKLRTIFVIVLPSAMPGILSGIILAIGRIVGETAALMYTAGSVSKACDNLMSSGRTLAVHMYCLSNEGLYTNQAYATAVVLVVIVFLVNRVSSLVANRIKKGD